MDPLITKKVSFSHESQNEIKATEPAKNEIIRKNQKAITNREMKQRTTELLKGKRNLESKALL